ncbi:multidrug resistance-associated protein 5-like [Pecten maximus]|uniref:multidrug resistance-associated protein 5-like n=1 Tax=Pecten maximus TaxID=6579 RepID=UPI0014588D36|nr:multidrug resistance-associated protein 5-like [Pecten maximus]
MALSMTKKQEQHNTGVHYSAAMLILSLFIGKHIGICGAVGCGKSSLLQALIGRMPLLSGHLAVAGSVAYAAQQAWIFNGTLRENILFGCPYQSDWYTRVLHACSLDPDLRILANGDMTEIGDRGTNLSGGQKQRVSLARAVYSKRDIYLLDDPLSAVDVQVGKHLFNKCIDTLLKDKTVVLVTHQLQYLERCDEIYVLDEGEIAEHGSHESLMAKNGHYTKLMEQFNSNMDRINSSDEEKSEDDDADFHKSNDVPTKQQFNGSTVTVNNYEKGILTEREKSQTGSISTDSYGSYIRRAGGKITVEEPESISIDFNLSSSNFAISADVTTSAVNTLNTTSFRSMDETEEQTDWYLMVYIYTTIGITGLGVLKGIVAGVVMTTASVNLHNRAVERVLGAPMQYFDANPPGRILNRFSRDVEEVDVFIPNMTDNLLQAMIMITASIISTAINFPVYLVAVVAVIVYVYIIKTIATVPLRNFKRLENVVRSPLISHVTTSCSGLNTIVSYSQENNFMTGCKHYSNTTSMALLLYEACIRWMGLRVDFGGSVLTIVTSIVVLATKGSLPPTLAALSLTMSVNVTSLAQFCTRMLNEVEARFTSVERIHEYENLEVEKETGNLHVDKKWPSQGRIVFSNVVMRYRFDMDPVLQNINFDILPKQKVGIVGRTGAGKSSLAAALFRLTDISEGHVSIDDVDIGSISRKLLRSRLSSIPQDPVLFAGTLRYNLDPFDEYTDAQIWDALQQVHMKEKTLDLIIQENGENFSVGERQLICLARAILRQNKILVLDEATASIDTSTDAMIQETIRDSFSDCTVLTIAHRLNTVLHCDVILVMEAGKVIEMGNPQALLQNPSSHFNSMIRAQTLATDE